MRSPNSVVSVSSRGVSSGSISASIGIAHADPMQVAELQPGFALGLERAVQEADVRGIVVAFVRLQVVALDEHLRRVQMLGPDR